MSSGWGGQRVPRVLGRPLRERRWGPPSWGFFGAGRVVFGPLKERHPAPPPPPSYEELTGPQGKEVTGTVRKEPRLKSPKHLGSSKVPPSLPPSFELWLQQPHWGPGAEGQGHSGLGGPRAPHITAVPPGSRVQTCLGISPTVGSALGQPGP